MSDTSAVTPSTSAPKAPSKAGWVLLVVAWVLFLIPFPGLGLLGWVINLVAFIVAIVVIIRGAVVTGIIQIVCSIVVSGIIYFIGIAVFAAAIHGASVSHKTSLQNSEQSICIDPAIVKIMS